MRILVTNDDGIYSPGLWSAARALKDVGEVTVVAPDRDLSGIASARTLVSVVRVHEISPQIDGVKTFSVEGTPADSVILAVEALVEEPFDLVVSGINQGSNLGIDVLNSGTVGAAFQGYFRNINSVAVSVAALSNIHYEVPSLSIRALARALLGKALPSPLLLNVNVPNIVPAHIEGVEITKLGPRAFLESVERGSDGRGTHYWIKHNRPVGANAPQGTDMWAVRHNRISITPMVLSLSSPDSSTTLNSLAEGVIEAVRTKVPS